MVPVRNPHKQALWGFLFAYLPILSAWVTGLLEDGNGTCRKRLSDPRTICPTISDGNNGKRGIMHTARQARSRPSSMPLADSIGMGWAAAQLRGTSPAHTPPPSIPRHEQPHA
jgi:hypothetical protein